MVKLHYMPFWITDYLADTIDLTTEQHGAYVLLLLHMWKSRGVLSGDPVVLARLARVDPARWPQIWDVIGPYFKRANRTHITQKRLAKEHARGTAEAGARQRAGKLGGDATARKRKHNSGSSGVGAVQQPISITTVKEESPPYPPSRGCKLVSDWTEKEVTGFKAVHKFDPSMVAAEYREMVEGSGGRRRRSKMTPRERFDETMGKREPT